MSERRALTAVERAAAANFDRGLEAKGLSNELASVEIGVTPAAVGHWRRGEIPIPLKRAALIGNMLGVDPGQICAEWGASVGPYLMASQPVQLDAGKLATSIAALRQVASRQGWTYDPETHAEETVAAYLIACAMPAKPSTADVIDFGARVADLLQKRAEEAGHGRQRADEQAGGSDRRGIKASGKA